MSPSEMDGISETSNIIKELLCRQFQLAAVACEQLNLAKFMIIL